MTETTPATGIVPPPWRLTGTAYVLIYRFSDAFVNERVALPPELQGQFVGGLGALMLVDYATSPVGSYREMLFSPGQFAFRGKKHHSITHIYVSSQASVENGRANWGLPKQLASFQIENLLEVERWRVEHEGRLLLDVRFRPGRLTFPVPGWLYRPRLMQPWQGSAYVTRFKVSGRGQLADLEQPKTGGDFPNIANARPLGVLHMPRFNLTFPAPRQFELS